MTTSLIFLTPLLVLIIVGLFGFVGCHIVFGIDHVDDIVPGPSNFKAEAGDSQVALSWDAYKDATQFDWTRTDTIGGTTLTRPVTMFDPAEPRVTTTDDTAVNDVTYSYSVTATAKGTKSSSSEKQPATPTAASRLDFVSSPFMGFSPINSVTGQYGMAIDVGPAPITVKSLGRGSVPGPAMQPNTQTHIVKIVDRNGADVPGATTTVSMQGVPAGTFQYAQLVSPVTLAANTRYYIVSQEIAGQDFFFNHDMTIVVKDIATVPTSVRGGPPYVEDNTTLHSYGPVSFQY